MKKWSLKNILRVVAVAIFVIGAFAGYDMGDKMITVDTEVVYVFDFWLAVLVWFAAFAVGVLFLGVAQIIEHLENR